MKLLQGMHTHVPGLHKWTQSCVHTS